MRALLAVLLLCLCAPAMAGDRVAEFSDAVLTLAEKPCALFDAKPEDGLKGGTAVFRGRLEGRPSRALCWKEMDGWIMFVDETGFSNAFPAEYAQEVKPRRKPGVNVEG